MILTRPLTILPAAALLCFALTAGVPAPVNAESPSPIQDGIDGILKDLALEALKKSMGPGGEIISNSSSFVIDPLVDAATKVGEPEDKVDAWLKAFNRAGVEAVWPAYGFAVKGGKIVLDGFRGSLEELIASLQDDQNTAILLGESPDALLDREDNVMADSPFILNSGIAGLTAENLGERVPSEAVLKAKWDFYINTLRPLYGPKNTEIAAKNWPRLLKLWRMQRAAMVLDEFTRRVEREMNLAIRRAEERAAAGDTGTKAAAPKDVGPPVAPVPGTFGPPTKKLGRAPGPVENNNGKVGGSMSERSMTYLASNNAEPKASAKVELKWTGDLPAILKPGDIITLKSSVEATRSGPDAPNVFGNANWVVSGSVKILNEKKTFAGMASSGVWTPKDESGEVKFEVLSGGSINIYTKQYGAVWGSSDNWTPVEYNYTFTPKR